jgi:hypothetical protein
VRFKVLKRKEEASLDEKLRLQDLVSVLLPREPTVLSPIVVFVSMF